MSRLLRRVGAVTLVVCVASCQAAAAAGVPFGSPEFRLREGTICEDSRRPPAEGARSNDQLLANETFQRAVTDVERLRIVLRFCELRPDTLTLDLGPGAFASASSEYNLGRLDAAYRALTDYSPQSALELRYEDRIVGWYTAVGLSWIDKPVVPPAAAPVLVQADDPDLPIEERREGFHVGAGLGAGSFDQQCRGCDLESELGLSGYLSLGGWLGRKTVLGVEATGWAKEESGRGTLVYSAMAQVTRYAGVRSGLFLRAGAGLVGFRNDFDFTAAAPGFSGRAGYEFGSGKVHVLPYVGYVRTFDGTELKRDGEEVGFNFVISQLQFGVGVSLY